MGGSEGQYEGQYEINHVLLYMYFLFQCVFVLNSFCERLSSTGLYTRLKLFLQQQRHLELSQLYKEVNNTPSATPPPSPKKLYVNTACNTSGVTTTSWQHYSYKPPIRPRPIQPHRYMLHPPHCYLSSQA